MEIRNMNAERIDAVLSFIMGDYEISIACNSIGREIAVFNHLNGLHIATFTNDSEGLKDAIALAEILNRSNR